MSLGYKQEYKALGFIFPLLFIGLNKYFFCSVFISLPLCSGKRITLTRDTENILQSRLTMEPISHFTECVNEL